MTCWNGAIHSDVLKALLATIKPYAPPTAAEVTVVIDDIQSNYLSLSKNQRRGVPEYEYASLSEIPTLIEYVKLLREVMSLTDFQKDEAGNRVPSVAAAVGMTLINMPGFALETFQIRDDSKACEDRLRKLEEFFKSIGTQSPLGDDVDNCLQYGVRPLAWDLMASTLRWDGIRRRLNVTKIDEIDSEKHLFKAQVMEDGHGPFTVYLAREQNRLRIHLFDEGGRLNALKNLDTTPPGELDGYWLAEDSRAPLPAGGGFDSDSKETLSISAKGDLVRVRHVITTQIYAPTGQSFTHCPGNKTQVVERLVQQLSGAADDGKLMLTPDAESSRTGDAQACMGEEFYSADALASVKIVGTKLVMYRTDGEIFPESQEFERTGQVAGEDLTPLPVYRPTPVYRPPPVYRPVTKVAPRPRTPAKKK